MEGSGCRECSMGRGVGGGKRMVGERVAGGEGKEWWGGRGVGQGSSCRRGEGVAAGERVLGGRGVGAGQGFVGGR